MNDLIEGLYNILTDTISNKRFYSARSLGFRAELKLFTYFGNRNNEILDGGQFLFGNRNESHQHNLIYVTVSDTEQDDYIQFYKKLSVFPLVKEMYFIKYSSNEDWGRTIFKVKDENENIIEIQIPKPNFTYYKYENDVFSPCTLEDITSKFERKSGERHSAKKTNELAYLSEFSQNIIRGVYSNRFFLDVLLGGYKKGMIDFDGILKSEGRFILLESKEKDRGGENPNQFFGWDSRRFPWYLYLQLTTGMQVLYVIREVNNQVDREFVDWMYIEMEDFAKSASWLSETGGGGGSGTITVPVGAFKKLDDLRA
ncbi:MAG: hypothetical protein ISR99_00595 [Parcubacteria group bacterium]|nr:hypothetical protein [Parcubacteria group bacterium]